MFIYTCLVVHIHIARRWTYDLTTTRGSVRPMASARECFCDSFFFVELPFHDDFQPKALGSAV
jgi:hypothetical protein